MLVVYWKSSKYSRTGQYYYNRYDMPVRSLLNEVSHIETSHRIESESNRILVDNPLRDSDVLRMFTQAQTIWNTRTLGIKRIQFIFVRSLYSIWAVWVHFEFLYYYKLFNSSYTVHKITLNIKVKLINNYGRKK